MNESTVSKMDWNRNYNNTYCFHKPKGGFEDRPIPSHPCLGEIYTFAFEYAYEHYCKTGGFEECLKQIEERFGPIDLAVKNYIINCPYDAGDRAGMLREDPNHYD